MESPYLSIVIAVRNDNYGGDFISRLQRGLNWNSNLLERLEIDSEIVLVNWNPVPENASLQTQINWPKGLKFVNIRIIEVSSELHKAFLDQNLRDPVPMFEFLAKNVGIRRSKGEFILSINADILVHESIFRFIAQKKVIKESYYRVNRLDFEGSESTDARKMISAGSVVSLKGFMYEFQPGYNKEIQYRVLKIMNHLRLEWEFWKVRNSKFCNRYSISVSYDNGSFVSHCLNSGDFMLMHRDNWLRLKGYSEYVFSAVHTDAIMTILSYSFLKEKVFPRPILHQQHERRYSWKSMESDPKFEDTYQLFKEIARVVRQNGVVDEYLNDDSWGINGAQLPEISINR